MCAPLSDLSTLRISNWNMICKWKYVASVVENWKKVKYLLKNCANSTFHISLLLICCYGYVNNIKYARVHSIVI
jgi:hypothetical protein